MSHNRANGGVADSGRPLLISSILGAAIAVATMAGTLIGVLAPYLRDEIAGLTPANVGFLVTAYAVVSGALARPAGMLADSVGGRATLMMVFAGSILGLGFLALAPTFGFLIVAMSVAGVASSALDQATQRVITRWVGPGDRGLVAGISMAGAPVAVVVGGISIPPLAETIGWRAPLVSVGVLVAGIGTIGALATLRGSEDLGGHGNGRSTFEWRGGWAVLTTYGMFMSAGTSAAVTYMTLFTVEDLGSTARVGGFAVAVIGLLAVVGRVALVRATTRPARPMRSLTIAAAAAALAAAVIALSDSAGSPLYWVGTAGLGLTALSFVVATKRVVITSTPTEEMEGSRRPASVGVVIGFGVGPAAFGAVLGASGSYAVGWVLVMALFGAATVTAWMGWRLHVLDTSSIRRRPLERRNRSSDGPV